MTGRRPARIVDAHVHLWDPARTDWYPYLSGRQELGMGDTTGMARRFDVATYRAEAAGWNVEKLVNVAAATGRHSIDETLELDRASRRRRPAPPPSSAACRRPTRWPRRSSCSTGRWARRRFRGVRPMGAVRRARSPAATCSGRCRSAAWCSS